MYIVADFTKLFTFEDYRNVIESKIRNLDVSMLILNAGIGAFDSFEVMPDEKVSDILHCNMMHVSYLPKLMAKQLTSRLGKTGQKAAMIFVSSISAIRPFPAL